MKKMHYAWIILVVTFVALLSSAGVRNAATVLVKPLEAEFGWTRAAISLASAVSLFAFGLGAPFGGALIDRFGPRRVMIGGLALVVVSLVPLISLSELWQLHVFWGVIGGVGTGALAGTLGASVALRWFNQSRGLVLGIFGAAAAAGQLIFVPGLLALSRAYGWRSVIIALAVMVGVVLIPVILLMRSRPEDAGMKPYGQATTNTMHVDTRATPLREALRTRDFWLLAMSFFVCGYTTNGLIGFHLLPHSLEHGFAETDISWAIGVMGVMNILGTTASGWLSERVDNRKLLAMYYGFRGLSLAALPFILGMQGMLIFAVIYGLDWVATVPPTVNLTAQRFGRGSLGTIYGWIFCSHMIGAGLASLLGGVFRDLLGDYTLIFISAAVLGVLASALSLQVSISARRPQLATSST